MNREAVSGMLLTLLLVATLTLALTIQPARTIIIATIIVPDHYPTIQQAINAANEGDTIFVRNGTYYENIVINKAVSLIGQNRSTTIIDGNGVGDVMRVVSNGVSIEGLTVRNSGGEYPNSGIFLDNVRSCRISDNNVSHNLGHGIFLMWANDNNVSNNLVTFNGEPGIRVDVSKNKLIGNYLRYNDVDGIFLYGAFDCLIEGNVAYHNTMSGIAIQGGSTNITLKKNKAIGNRWGISSCCCSNSSLIESNILQNNWCGIDISTDDFCNTVIGNTVVDNEVGIQLISNSNQTIYHNNFIDNTEQAYIQESYKNTWDNGYPFGGNYWSDQDHGPCADHYNGPDQKISGSDGIVDIPYVIDKDNQDHYPLMGYAPGTSVPPKPDLKVSLAAPLFVEPGDSVLLNVTLCNKGRRDKIDVDLVLLIDGGVVCSETFPVLKVGECKSVNFSWAPVAEGKYNVTAYTPPVQNETKTENNIASKYVYVGVSPPPRRFRLLAVEQMFDSYRMKGAQYLIIELLNYPNWNNSTDQYVSHIHLLSLYNSTEVDPEVKDYLRGKPSKVKDEFKNFLGQAVPGEIVIFYYNGHSRRVMGPPTFLGISPTLLNNWLTSGGLPQSSVAIILDTCWSGYWTEVLPNCNVLAACKSNQLAWGGRWGGIFTEGLVEGFSTANESNGDGWLSTEEVFAYAKPYTQSIAEMCGLRQNPTCYYGVVEGDLPLVQRVERPFPLWDIAVTSVEVLAEDVMESGLPVLIDATVENQGTKLGIFNVTIYYNTSFIETTKVTLNPQENATLRFTWNTTGLDGIFQISAEVSISPGEVDTLDNTYIGGVIRIARLPIITVVSPENMTYSMGPISLTFCINEATSWIGYSLDNQANVTITGNSTLSSLPIGTHTIIVYANDTYGDMGFSDTVYFTIICDLN